MNARALVTTFPILALVLLAMAAFMLAGCHESAGQKAAVASATSAPHGTAALPGPPAVESVCRECAMEAIGKRHTRGRSWLPRATLE
jgi:PBP1b-binding outer membrane lipoprotein LpoB